MNDTNTNDNQKSTENTPGAQQTPSEEQKEESRFPLWVSLLALFGILIVVVIAAVGIVRIAGNAEGNLSRLGSGIADIFRGSERIELDVNDPRVASGDETTISIDHRNKSASDDEGEYSLTVECPESVTPLVNGTEATCDEEVALEGTLDEATVTLTSTSDEQFIDVPVSVSYLHEDTELTSEIILTLVNEEAEDDESDEETDEETENGEETPEEQEEGREDTDSTPSYQAPTRQGTPDLSVAVIGMGRMENGRFVADDHIDEDDRAAVRFVITNAGTASTGPWTYSAILPLTEAEVYNSDRQASLNPGDRKEFTLEFDDINTDDARFYVSVDPLNNIEEITDLNNLVRVEFDF